MKLLKTTICHCDETIVKASSFSDVAGYIGEITHEFKDISDSYLDVVLIVNNDAIIHSFSSEIIKKIGLKPEDRVDIIYNKDIVTMELRKMKEGFKLQKESKGDRYSLTLENKREFYQDFLKMFEEQIYEINWSEDTKINKGILTNSKIEIDSQNHRMACELWFRRNLDMERILQS